MEIGQTGQAVRKLALRVSKRELDNVTIHPHRTVARPAQTPPSIFALVLMQSVRVSLYCFNKTLCYL